MLSAGRAAGIRDADGRLVATSIVLAYPPAIGWIGMVLVTTPLAGDEGYATRLLDAAIAWCRDVGLSCRSSTPPPPAAKSIGGWALPMAPLSSAGAAWGPEQRPSIAIPISTSPSGSTARPSAPTAARSSSSLHGAATLRLS